jgi:hypothetical protein
VNKIENKKIENVEYIMQDDGVYFTGEVDGKQVQGCAYKFDHISTSGVIIPREELSKLVE